MTSFPFVGALLPCAFGSRAKTRQSHKVFLEAGVGGSLPFPLRLRGEERVLESHTWGRGLLRGRQQRATMSKGENVQGGKDKF